ncbi:hypothetical protein GYMLUDRAFT_909956 [Collybiopsis luxurians FD-317 M1]|nr:hypothetical protein GYMLUDRAFT_909956 [Collybiopsis luxurians FD-317 M1]
MSTDIAAFDDQPLSRSRQSGSGSLASIWAPQPQPSDTTWPKALDSFSRAVDPELTIKRPDLQHHSSMPGPVTSEDVFGPTLFKEAATSVGAIGDGRKKVTPDFEPHTHVEQLLRTLDLNSPDPYHLGQKPPLNLSLESSPGTPDFSPISISSGLLTPTDLSPTRPFDANSSLKQQLHSPYDMMAAGTRGSAYLTHPSLLFEPGSPTRPSNSPPYLSSHQVNIAAANAVGPNYSIISNASSYPIFKTYSNEQSSPAPLTAPSLPSAQTYTLYHPSQLSSSYKATLLAAPIFNPPRACLGLQLSREQIVPDSLANGMYLSRWSPHTLSSPSLL